MEALLYAEVYVICLIITGILLYWDMKNGSDSASERWLRAVLIAFLGNFAANLLFTVFNNLPFFDGIRVPVGYIFKTLYHVSLCAGVYAWCGFADIQGQGRLFSKKQIRRLTLILVALPVIGVLLNLRTHLLFEITAEGVYIRHQQFHWEMGYLVAMSLYFSVQLMMKLPRELEPTRRSHIKLTASFPLCLLAAWGLSFVGERVPVICVSITIELLCLYMDTSTQQISMDKLTQVNNRQNLLSFLEYKIVMHEESIFLLMIDVDYFKTINDTYGHLEGDEALTHLSKVLKAACAGYRRRPYIGRYGGDEFIIILEGTREETDSLCEGIRERLKKVCEENNKPYNLTVSIGVARWHPDMDPQGFIAAADAQLYEIKRARKKPE